MQDIAHFTAVWTAQAHLEVHIHAKLFKYLSEVYLFLKCKQQMSFCLELLGFGWSDTTSTHG